jgi:dihydrofolate synthase/folylpolyglutamate synthase
MTSYESAVERLYALGHELQHGPSRKFELAHIRTLCQALDDPQRSFASVLIAGTNGKGSTAATLASILQASGQQRVGLYTSPHLLRINERICVQGEPIGNAAFAASYDRVTTAAAELVAASALPHLPSFFETVTAMAFDYFAASGVEIAVLEVGMGGRLDATNIVEPIVSVITDIDLDHQKFLGNTIAEIAYEKAGILRPNVVAVTLPQHPEANQVLGERMAALGARAVCASRNLAGNMTGNTETGETRFPLKVLGEEVEIVSPLVGRHQLRNLALAITAAEELASQGFGITAESIARGTRQTRWPCRFQGFAAAAGRPEIIVDVAHNPAGARALRSALNERMGTERMEQRRMVLLFGAMADKAVEEMAGILWPAMAHVVLTRTANNARAAATADLATLAQSLGVEHSVSASVRQGLEMAMARALALGPEAVVVVAGSIYVAGEAVQALQ